MADALAAASTVRSWPESNISTPDATTAASGSTNGDERERDDAAPQAGNAPGQEREPDADREGGRGHRDRRADHGENR